MAKTNRDLLSSERFAARSGAVFLIRRLKADDYENVRAYLRSFAAETVFTNQYPGQPEKSKEQLTKGYADENALYLGVFADDRLIGASSVKIERPGHPWARNAVFGIGMLKDFYHQGIGTELMIRMENWAREKRVHRIEGLVRTANLPAIGLYLKRGFVIEGRKRECALIDGVWHDEYVIAKLLTS